MSSGEEGDETIDPFFALDGDAEWNAFVGRQADEGSYVDGYIEAALELATAVIEKRMIGSRDTLVMPILYNARHGVELAFKAALRKLRGVGLALEEPGHIHDIVALWKKLEPSKLGDEALREIVGALGPFVMSLGRMDEDGQEFRYPYRTDGEKSLSDLSLANIERIRASVQQLKEHLEFLGMRVADLRAERLTKAYTAECSRRDLFEIARMLPSRKDWATPSFVDAKAAIQERYGLSGNGFCRALDLIQANREMGMRIGLEFDLAHLTDDLILQVLEEWGSLHPPRKRDSMDVGVSPFSTTRFRRDREQERAANAAILGLLNADQLADLETIFYLGRQRDFGEHYAADLERRKKEHKARDDAYQVIYDLTAKTSLAMMLAEGVERLGRPSLGERIRAWRPDLFPAA